MKETRRRARQKRQRPDSNLAKPRYLEYDLSEYNLAPDEMRELSELVVKGFVYLRLRDKAVVATVGMSAVKGKSILLKLKFSDQTLDTYFDNEKYVQEYYQLLDPFECILHDPQ